MSFRNTASPLQHCGPYLDTYLCEQSSFFAVSKNISRKNVILLTKVRILPVKPQCTARSRLDPSLVLNREYFVQACQLGEMKSVVERIEQTPSISIQIGRSLLFHPEVCLLQLPDPK